MQCNRNRNGLLGNTQQNRFQPHVLEMGNYRHHTRIDIQHTRKRNENVIVRKGKQNKVKLVNKAVKKYYWSYRALYVTGDCFHKQ